MFVHILFLNNCWLVIDQPVVVRASFARTKRAFVSIVVVYWQEVEWRSSLHSCFEHIKSKVWFPAGRDFCVEFACCPRVCRFPLVRLMDRSPGRRNKLLYMSLVVEKPEYPVHYASPNYLYALFFLTLSAGFTFWTYCILKLIKCIPLWAPSGPVKVWYLGFSPVLSLTPGFLLHSGGFSAPRPHVIFFFFWTFLSQVYISIFS